MGNWKNRPRHGDRRFTVRPEWSGHRKRQQVARFCGEWLGAAASAQEAWSIAGDWARINLPSYWPAEAQAG